MKLLLASIASRLGTGAAQALLDSYVTRLSSYQPAEVQLHRSEQAFLDFLARQHARTALMLVLLDSRGKQLSSEALAVLLRREQDAGRQSAIFAVGPANGWSSSTRELVQRQGGLLLSFGPMTLPHELARVLLAEQLYRACTILAGHPYHSGH